MWFPEMFNRFDEYSKYHNGTSSASVCQVANFVVSMGTQGHSVCGEKISEAVFMDSLITVAAAFPSNFIAVLGMDKLGRKFFLGN